MTTPGPTPGTTPGPLSPEHLQQLTAAKSRGSAIRRAHRFSRFNAWTLAFFAAITGLLLLLSIPKVGAGAFVLLAMITSTTIEFLYGNRLKQLSPGAARVIGWNQIALGLALAAYCGWRIYRLTHGEQIISTPELAQLVDDEAKDLASHIAVITYAGIALIVLIYQSLVGLYYFRIESKVAAYKRDTPTWIIEAQQRGVVA